MPPLKFMGGSSRDELDTRELKLPPAFPLWHMQSGKGGGAGFRVLELPPTFPLWHRQSGKEGGGRVQGLGL